MTTVPVVDLVPFDEALSGISDALSSFRRRLRRASDSAGEHGEIQEIRRAVGYLADSVQHVREYLEAREAARAA